MISSSEVEAARNPIAEPTRPDPIIDMIVIHLLDHKYWNLGFVDN